MRGRMLIVMLALLAPMSLTSARAGEFVVVVYNDLGVEGDMNAPWSESDENVDHRLSTNGQDTYLVRTIKAHLGHFLATADLHGNTVSVQAYASQGGLTSPCGQRLGEATIIMAELSPDAVVTIGDNMDCFIDVMATAGIMTFGSLQDYPRSTFTATPGMVWSFAPDQIEQGTATSSFICRALAADETGTVGAGRATFAFDPDLQERARRFGLIYPVAFSGSQSRGPRAQENAELLMEQTHDLCGLQWENGAGDDGSNLVRIYPESSAGTRELPLFMSEFKANEITTVICYCVPVATELTTTKMVAAARALDYHPEYFWDHTSRMDKPIWQRYYGPRMPEASFGVTKYWMMPALEQQEHYQAYLSQEPGTEPNERFSFEIYWSFWTLFTAIERSAGDFTPAGVSEGLLGYEVRPGDPSLASGGFTGDNPYTFLDGGMAFWFDPLEEEPGVDLPVGCNRSTGARVFDGAWPFGDGQLYSDAAACWGGPHSAGITP